MEDHYQLPSEEGKYSTYTLLVVAGHFYHRISESSLNCLNKNKDLMELYSMLKDKKDICIKCFYHKNPLNVIFILLIRITCSFVLIIYLNIPA